MASSITIENVDAAYGAVRVLEEVTLEVKPGETVVLLGTNGNGKSTLMKCIMGMVRPSAGSVSVEIDGTRHDLVGRSTEEIVDLGIALVPEGRRLFPRQTVEENLLLGAFRKKARESMKTNLDFCYECFPRLAERLGQQAGTLSGGEQQQLALAKALMLDPTVLCIDELCLGLAPVVIGELLEIVRQLNEIGITLLLVEQSLNIAAQLCSRAIFLEKGEVRFAGQTADLLEQDDIARAVFFGGSDS